MRTLSKQRGMSPVAWIAVLLVVGFFAYFGVKVIPAYFNYYSLINVVEGVKDDRTLRDASVGKLRGTLRKRLRLNDIDDLGDDAVQIQRRGGQIEVVIDYREREPFMANIDLLIEFERSYTF